MTDVPEVSGERLVRNTTANAVGGVVVAVLAILMTPFLLRRLGPAEYGIWLLATGLTFGSGYLGIADLGLQQAGVRFVAEARSRNDTDAVNELISTLVAAFACLGLVLAALAALVAGALTHAFNVDPGLRHAAHAVFLLVGLQIAIDLPVAGLLALIEGAQRYAQLRLIEIGTRVAWAVLTVAVVWRGHGVVALGVVSLALAGTAAVVAFVLARRVEPSLALHPRLASWPALRGMTRYGASFLVLRTLSIIYRQMDRAIIGVALTAAAVARYEVAYKIHATAALVLSFAPSAVMPAAAYLGAAGDRQKLRSIYLRGTKYAIALSLPVTIAALLYAKALIVTWVGTDYEDVTGITRLFLIYPALVVVHTIGLTMLVGLGRMREMVLLNVVSVALNLVLSIVLVGKLGIGGVVWGTLFGYAVLWIPYTLLFWQQFEVRPATWLRSVVLPNLPGLVAQVTMGLVTLRVVEDMTELWQVALAFAANCGVSVGVFSLLGLKGDERRNLLRIIRGSYSGSR